MTSDKPDFGHFPADELGDDEFKRLLGQALAGEPPLGVNRDEVLRRGQRRLRTRRTAMAGGVAAGVVAVVLGAAVLTGGGQFALQGEVVPGSGQTSVSGPATTTTSPSGPIMANPMMVYGWIPPDRGKANTWPVAVTPPVLVTVGLPGPGAGAPLSGNVATRLTQGLAPALRLSNAEANGISRSASIILVPPSGSTSGPGSTGGPPSSVTRQPPGSGEKPVTATITSVWTPPGPNGPGITFSPSADGYYQAAVDLGDDQGVGSLLVQVAAAPGAAPLDCHTLDKAVSDFGWCREQVVDQQRVLIVEANGPGELVRHQVISQRDDGTRVAVTTTNIADAALQAGQRSPGRPTAPLSWDELTRIATLPALAIGQ